MTKHLSYALVNCYARDSGRFPTFYPLHFPCPEIPLRVPFNVELFVSVTCTGEFILFVMTTFFTYVSKSTFTKSLWRQIQGRLKYGRANVPMNRYFFDDSIYVLFEFHFQYYHFCDFDAFLSLWIISFFFY